MPELAGRFPRLDLNDSVAEAVEAYIANQVMPNDPGGDAFHLGLAVYILQETRFRFEVYDRTGRDEMRKPLNDTVAFVLNAIAAGESFA